MEREQSRQRRAGQSTTVSISKRTTPTRNENMADSEIRNGKRNKTNLIKKLFPAMAFIFRGQTLAIPITKYFSLLSHCEFPLLPFLHFYFSMCLNNCALNIHTETERKTQRATAKKKHDGWKRDCAMRSQME